MRYAEQTTVPAEKSRAEIETTLVRYGAERFAYMTMSDRATIAFEAKGRLLRFDVPLPDRNDRDFWTTPGRRGTRTAENAHRAWEQACRQRWRALALAIKAKLEVVETGISTFESEFLAHIVLPGNGQTIAEWITPQMERLYETKKMPPLLVDMR
jgi:hypothetical protein